MKNQFSFCCRGCGLLNFQNIYTQFFFSVNHFSSSVPWKSNSSKNYIPMLWIRKLRIKECDELKGPQLIYTGTDACTHISHSLCAMCLRDPALVHLCPAGDFSPQRTKPRSWGPRLTSRILHGKVSLFALTFLVVAQILRLIKFLVK